MTEFPRDLSPDHPVGSRARIGALLVAGGALDEARLADVLALQKESGARLGEIVVRRGLASHRQVSAAAAVQAGLGQVDLVATPIDATLADETELSILLAHRMAPLRRADGEVVYAATDRELALRGHAALGRPETSVRLALAPADELAAATVAAFGPALARRAAARPEPAMSARTRGARLGGIAAALAAAALFGASVIAPWTALAVVVAALTLLNGANALVRIAVLSRALRPPRDPARPEAPAAVVLAERRPPPRISLLIPLLDEPETLPILLDALESLDWPRELLDVKLILEEGDHRTSAALAAHPPPPFCQVLVAPPGRPRTKPRALNFALDFCDGEIVGVYDAEDKPEPDQLRRVASILRSAPPEVACVQCRLAYFNPRETWLTRCFSIEYAIWFDVLVAGFRDLRLPIPLGGTSIFFRRSALEAIGAWDAHNVTEDADLGMRLARAGFRCEVSASTTREEASSRPGQWLRQRSRWLKGYMTTWLVHMRRPVQLWRDLGVRGFVAFQAIFLGAVAAYLGLPLVWAAWAASFSAFGPGFSAESYALLGALSVVQIAGWGAMIVAATAATARRGDRWLWPWIPTLAFYWPLGAIAAWIALIELAVAPTFWRKTPHGIGRAAAEARKAAIVNRAGPAVAPDRRAAS